MGTRASVETLPEDQRDVIVLRDLVGLSPEEIVHRMGRTESSIHGLDHRARACPAPRAGTGGVRTNHSNGRSRRPLAPTEEISWRWPVDCHDLSNLSNSVEIYWSDPSSGNSKEPGSVSVSSSSVRSVRGPQIVTKTARTRSSSSGPRRPEASAERSGPGRVHSCGSGFDLLDLR